MHRCCAFPFALAGLFLGNFLDDCVCIYESCFEAGFNAILSYGVVWPVYGVLRSCRVRHEAYVVHAAMTREYFVFRRLRSFGLRLHQLIDVASAARQASRRAARPVNGADDNVDDAHFIVRSVSWLGPAISRACMSSEATSRRGSARSFWPAGCWLDGRPHAAMPVRHWYGCCSAPATTFDHFPFWADVDSTLNVWISAGVSTGRHFLATVAVTWRLTSSAGADNVTYRLAVAVALQQT